jgi:hypothetical protein
MIYGQHDNNSAVASFIELDQNYCYISVANPIPCVDTDLLTRTEHGSSQNMS